MSDDRRVQLRDDLARYTDRWRATDRLIEQRVTVLVAVITVCVAIVAIDTRDATTNQTRAAVWGFAAVLCLGTFERLVTGRVSIIRSIAILNLIRRELLAISPDELKEYHTKVLEADSTLPSAHKWLSSQMAAALAASAMAALALREVKLWTEPLTYSFWTPEPYQLWLIPGLILVGCAVYALRRASNFTERLTEMGLVT